MNKFLWRTCFLAVVGVAMLADSPRLLAERRALLIAAPKCEQKGLPALFFAESDVRRLASLLGAVGYDQVVVMTPPAKPPTSRAIRTQLKRLAAAAAADDCLLVVLTGHGVQLEKKGPVYFFPADGSLRRSESLISIEEVKVILQTSPARKKLVLADVCRNRPGRLGRNRPGGLKIAGKARRPVGPLAGPRKAPPIVFYSCSPGEQCYEDPRIQQSVFLHFVTEGLRGDADQNDDGKISLAELAPYVIRETPKYVRRRLQKIQRPHLDGELGKGSIIVAESPQ